MKHLKLFNENYSYTSDVEIDEAMQWFIDQFDVDKIYNIRKTICAFKTRDKFKLTENIAKDLIRLTQKVHCDITLSMSYRLGEDSNYLRLEEKLHKLAKPLLTFASNNDINCVEMIISFVFAPSDDILDPYYLSYSLETNVLRFDKVPFSILEKLIETRDMNPTEHVANSSFTTAYLMNDLEKYKDRIIFNGLRVIDRPDARVQIEGFLITDLDNDEMIDLEVYKGADTFNLDRKKRTLYTWWD